MDENMNFEETPWIFPIVDKGTIGIPEMAAIVAKEMGVDASEVENVMNLYNDAVMHYLHEGKIVPYMGIGYLIPELDENGELVSYSFEVSEEFEQKLNDEMRKNPSLN